MYHTHSLLITKRNVNGIEVIMSSTTNNTLMSESLTFTQVALGVYVLAVYLLGLNLHTKVIRVCRKEKHSSWTLDIIGSCVTIFYYGQMLIMRVITDIIDDLHSFTGEWFCYTYMAFHFYGLFHVSMHSMVIALFKYISIVWHNKAEDIGRDKIKTIFNLISIISPAFVIAIFLLSRPDFFTAYRGMHVTNTCLGRRDLNLTMSVNGSASKLHDLCEISEQIVEVSFETVVYIARRLLCWTNVILFYLNLWNVTECIIYIRIFGNMRR